MTPDEAADLAARINAAIGNSPTNLRAADRERVASDLAGLRQHRRSYCEERGLCTDPCPDVRRYADNLTRTAHLYAVTP